MSEYYNQLLVPALKTYRPAATDVAQFVERLVEYGYFGEDYAIRFVNVVKVEPRSEPLPNPFTGKMGKRKTKSRRLGAREELTAVLDIVSRAEAADEYDVFISCTVRPPRSMLELGSMQSDGQWRHWDDNYGLDVGIFIRSSLVQVCCELEGKPEVASLVYWDPVDEDSIDGDAIGLSCHPESRELIPVRGAGCAMAWVRVTPGKFLYPRLKDGSLELLDNDAADAAKQLFAGEFVQACEWG